MPKAKTKKINSVAALEMLSRDPNLYLLVVTGPYPQRSQPKAYLATSTKVVAPINEATRYTLENLGLVRLSHVQDMPDDRHYKYYRPTINLAELTDNE